MRAMAQEVVNNENAVNFRILPNKVQVKRMQDFDESQMMTSFQIVELTLCRLMSLKRRLKHSNDFLQDYAAFMKELMGINYTGEIPCRHVAVACSTN